MSAVGDKIEGPFMDGVTVPIPRTAGDALDPALGHSSSFTTTTVTAKVTVAATAHPRRRRGSGAGPPVPGPRREGPVARRRRRDGHDGTLTPEIAAIPYTCTAG
ncbi:hypothetical protein RB628_18235 [Streptomyces sp. ADMS]|uniref:hypothetical protein n=1 Tax=Streptomyces sp. ADMS TaxID=3071415 RepID=UPI00296F4B86|nr:hypothetical protein [Streptomyces sp. ADMS]MDW4907237.1 hypothetical protein [Streptomyces sp. ADMS]